MPESGAGEHALSQALHSDPQPSDPGLTEETEFTTLSTPLFSPHLPTMQSRIQRAIVTGHHRGRHPDLLFRLVSDENTRPYRNDLDLSAPSPAGSLQYRYITRSDLSRRTRQVLLLCALALSVIGMHHVPLSPHVTMSVETHAAAMPAPHAESPAIVAPQAQLTGDSGTGMGHDLLHMCLAVLHAAGGFVFLAWLLFAVGIGAFPHTARFRLWSRRVWRPPGTTGRSLLAFICVLRT